MLCPISESLFWGVSTLVTHSPSVPMEAPFVMVKKKKEKKKDDKTTCEMSHEWNYAAAIKSEAGKVLAQGSCCWGEEG